MGKEDNEVEVGKKEEGDEERGEVKVLFGFHLNNLYFTFLRHYRL